MQTLSIGRDASNNIVLNDKLVSRNHAQLVIMDNGQVVIRDLGSSNGLFVNGNRIKESYLTTGDVVKCGGAFVNWFQYIGIESNGEAATSIYKLQIEQNNSNSENELLEQYDLGTIFKYLLTKIFDIGNLFKSEWNKNKSILFFFLLPVGISLITLIYFYYKAQFSFFYQVILPVITIMLIFGVTQFLTFSLLLMKRNTTIENNLFAASIYSFSQFLTVSCFLFFVSLIMNDAFSTRNYYRGDGSFGIIYFFFSIFMFTIIASIFVSIIIFIYQYFRNCGVSKGTSIHFTIFSLTLNLLLQAGFVYFLISAAGTKFINILN